MSMTLEEAIKNREECLRYLEDIGAKATPSCVEAVRWSVKALKALRPVSREQVEKMRGEWIADGEKVPVDENGCPRDWAKCSVCGEYLTASEEYDCTGHFCPACGSPMTDEAVEMVMKRLEALKDGKNRGI